MVDFFCYFTQEEDARDCAYVLEKCGFSIQQVGNYWYEDTLRWMVLSSKQIITDDELDTQLNLVTVFAEEFQGICDGYGRILELQ